MRVPEGRPSVAPENGRRRVRSAPRPASTSGQTKVAALRLKRGLTQSQLADAAEISLVTLRRLETGATDNPSLRVRVNCALTLGVDLDAVIESRWLQRYDPPAPKPATRRRAEGCSEPRR